MSVSMWTCSVTRGLGELRWSSWASEAIREFKMQGGCSSYYFISTLHISASYQFNQAKGGGFHLVIDVWFSEVSNCGGDSRGSLIVSMSNVWFSTHPSAVKLHLILRKCSDFLCRYWRQPDMVAAVKSTRFLQGSWRDSAPLVEADKETDESNYLLWRLEHGHVIDAGGIFVYARNAGMIPSAAA
ncbi:hypothetical protein YC2023_015409 [Brassica napus]